MFRAALLGREIGYTKSPAVHAKIAAALGVELAFDVVDVTSDKLDGAVDDLLSGYDGFFITKPYKNDIKKYLNTVNTACGVNFVRCADKSGYNTDGVGFVCGLDAAFPDWRKDVSASLVLGAGGAAYAVTEALIKAGKKVYVLNRTIMNAAKLCSALGAELYLNQPAQMAVNCTSLGLKGEDALYAMCVLPEFDYGYDLIYSSRTPFLRRLEAAGARVEDGSNMLIYQAIEGDRILFGDRVESFDTQDVFNKVKSALCEES